jgi:hypothetical protein
MGGFRLYRKKPVIIQATELTEEMFWREEFLEKALPGKVYVASAAYNKNDGLFDCKFAVETLEGRMYCKVGWYWIYGIKGEEYFCAPDVFEATYELVNP